MYNSKNLFDVVAYNDDNFAECLSKANGFLSTAQIKQRKHHFEFFKEYFKSFKNQERPLGAKTILIERDYISRSYLDDYSNYYSYCFNGQYSKKTTRLHFFNKSFEREELIEELANNTNHYINDENYLGYIVVKNLPNVIFGPTIIKTYEGKSTEASIDLNCRHFIKRNYTVNLFGRGLTVESLAFQEQDKAVSACATVALWVAFNQTSHLFCTQLPSPNKITESAKNSYSEIGRVFPNEGLDHYQIGNAIDSTGLVLELRNTDEFSDINYLKAFIYAYMRAGLPVLLGISMGEHGKHLITVSGFKPTSKKTSRRKDFKRFADNIDEFYSHDDQVGPYSRLFLRKKKNILKKESEIVIQTSWWDEELVADKKEGIYHSVFIPIYKKIRIKFEDVYTDSVWIDMYFKDTIFENDKYFSWDIYLIASNKYKQEIANSEIAPSDKVKILSKPLSRYVWVSRLLYEDYVTLEFIYDTTDIASGNYCHMLNVFDPDIKVKFKEQNFINSFCDFTKSELKKDFSSIFID